MNNPTLPIAKTQTPTGQAGADCVQRMVGRLCRVFPRRTNATPDDALAYTTEPELWTEADEVHISVTWTYDLPRAEQLEKEWRHVAPTKIGGPATGMRGEDFTPGLYVKPGYVITSRGCPNKCWFCSVWKRDGTTRELPIHEGWNVLDDNLLACSEKHIRAVFAMLKRQPRKAEFTGGLEAKILQRWHVELLADLRPRVMYFAYDTPDDYEPLLAAGKMLKEAGIRPPTACCYVLVGWPKDTEDAADKRLREAWAAGFYPYAMVWRNKHGERSPDWLRFNAVWSQPACVGRMLREGTKHHAIPDELGTPLFAANGRDERPLPSGSLQPVVGLPSPSEKTPENK